MIRGLLKFVTFMIGAIWINVVVDHYINDIIINDILSVILFALWGLAVRNNVNMYCDVLEQRKRKKT